MKARWLPWILFVVVAGCTHEATTPFELRAETVGGDLTLIAINRSDEPQRIVLGLTGAPTPGPDAQIGLFEANGRATGACFQDDSGVAGPPATLGPGLPAILQLSLAELALTHCLKPGTHYLIRAVVLPMHGSPRSLSNVVGFDTLAAGALGASQPPG